MKMIENRLLYKEYELNPHNANIMLSIDVKILDCTVSYNLGLCMEFKLATQNADQARLRLLIVSCEGLQSEVGHLAGLYCTHLAED